MTKEPLFPKGKGALDAGDLACTQKKFLVPSMLARILLGIYDKHMHIYCYATSKSSNRLRRKKYKQQQMVIKDAELPSIQRGSMQGRCSSWGMQAISLSQQELQPYISPSLSSLYIYLVISLRSQAKQVREPWNRLTGSMTRQLNPPTATPFLDRKELHLRNTFQTTQQKANLRTTPPERTAKSIDQHKEKELS